MTVAAPVRLAKCTLRLAPIVLGAAVTSCASDGADARCGAGSPTHDIGSGGTGGAGGSSEVERIAPRAVRRGKRVDPIKVVPRLWEVQRDAPVRGRSDWLGWTERW